MTEEEQNSESFLERISGKRRPRIALMGEFSAGKSTLANLIIGTDPIPMQVVATRLPPIWISYGTDEPTLVDLNGNMARCDLRNFSEQDLTDIGYIKIQHDEQILERCDIIDMPGISDPNMPSDIWERMMPVVDGIIWCSPAPQAWRQSEAATWEGLEARVKKNSMLLLTRADMLLNDDDKKKVITRVKKETGEQFGRVLMVSLLEARRAVDDDRFWDSSGAGDFVEGFLALVDGIASELGLDPSCHGRTAGSSEYDGAVSEPPSIIHTREKVQPRRPTKRTAKDRASDLDPNVPESYTPKFS